MVQDHNILENKRQIILKKNLNYVMCKMDSKYIQRDDWLSQQ